MTPAAMTEYNETPIATTPTGNTVPGIEGMDDKDVQMPRIQMLQQKAKALNALIAAKVEGAAPGCFINTAAENTPIQFVEFVPAYMTKFWDAYKISGDKKEWQFRTFDANDTRLQGKRTRGEKRTLPDGTEYLLRAEVYEVITVVALVDSFPTVINFKGMNHGAGKDLYTRARKSGKPLWYWTYQVSSKPVGDQGNYAMVIAAGAEATQAQKDTAYGIYQSFTSKAAEKLNSAADVDETTFP